MNNEKEKSFVKGLFAYEPRDTAPDFIKCDLSLNPKSLAAWLAGQKEEWVKVQVKVSKNGKWYAEVNNWKPEKAAGTAKGDDNFKLKVDPAFSTDDIPF